MRKYILIIFALVCAINVFGQNRRIEKSIEKAIEANDVIIEDLKDTISMLNSQCSKLDSVIHKISKRRFPRSISEQELAVELQKFTIKGIWQNHNNIQAKLKLAKDTELSKYYFQIIEIYNSLNIPYNKTTNSENIKLLGNIKLLDCHVDDYKILSSSVNDYRFVMFELARVLKIIDGLSGTPKDIKEKLNESNELEFITDNIPYAHRCVERYINFRASNGGGNAKADLLSELKQACPDAFSDF